VSWANAALKVDGLAMLHIGYTSTLYLRCPKVGVLFKIVGLAKFFPYNKDNAKLSGKVFEG